MLLMFCNYLTMQIYGHSFNKTIPRKKKKTRRAFTAVRAPNIKH